MKISKTELIHKLKEAIESLSDDKDPSKELIVMGKALAQIGVALKGVSLRDARSVIQTIFIMNQTGLLETAESKKEKQ